MGKLRFGFLRRGFGHAYEEATHEVAGRFGPFIHTVMMFSDGMVLTSMPGFGVMIFDYGVLKHPGHYDWIDLDVTDEVESSIRTFAQSHVGDGYNWLGYAGGGAVEGREFCTEIIVMSCQGGALFVSINSHHTHSSEFHGIVASGPGLSAPTAVHVDVGSPIWRKE